MNRETIRQAVVAAVEARKATWSAYPLLVEYDNRVLVDTQTQTNPFLCVRIMFMDGEQVDLGSNPNHRVFGQIHMAAALRSGEGTARANELLDYFVPALHMKTLSGVRLWGSRPAKDLLHLGWVYSPCLIPFEADTLP